MDIEGWQVFLGLTLAVALYGFGVAVLGAPTSLEGFLIVVVFSGAGLLAGRVISERIADED